jgi:hypothetical protein
MQSVKCWMSSFNFLSLWQACDYIKEVITLFTDSAVWHLHEILATALLLTPSNKADTHLLPPQTFFPVDWTQDLMHASQMLNHWSHKPTPFLGILFLKQGLILSRLTLNLRSSYQHLPSSWNHSHASPRFPVSSHGHFTYPIFLIRKLNISISLANKKKTGIQSAGKPFPSQWYIKTVIMLKYRT